ncbi:hypothetical protein HYDPIDRAFT_93359, partial [Hydnomerulius pinastri MD-312]
NEWHPAYDCDTKQEILFRVIPIFLPADNPQQSELCSHVGLKGNFWCRICGLGGTEQERETNDAYHEHFFPGKPRDPKATLDAIKSQLTAAALGVQETVTVLQRQSGVKDKLAEFWIQQLIEKARALQRERIQSPVTCDKRLNSAPLRSQFRPGDHYNSLLTVPALDVHQDSPAEMLHTYLLGNDKYEWHLLNSPWTAAQCRLFATRLQSSNIDGLSIPPVRAAYIIQYKNGLIGKHFKTLQQLAFFHLDDTLCPPLVQDLCRATGELGALLWYHEIEDMDAYLSDLLIFVANLLDIWAKIDPKRIFVKAKLHILTHLEANIRRHGPAILFATEIFECFNAIFRMCSVLSNHLAASRDIAWSFADMERFKHTISGGWWKIADQTYVSASPSVTAYFSDVHIQRRLGFASRADLIPGMTKCPRKNRSATLDWRDIIGTSAVANAHPKWTTLSWNTCTQVISQQQDVCRVGSWVFVNAEVSLKTVIGRIRNILQADGETSGESVVVLDQFTVSNGRHPHFGMPEVIRPHNPCLLTVPSIDILFIANVQHNCHDTKCTPSGRRFRQQERMNSSVEEHYIEHKDDDNFLLNTHALHNAAVLRKTLPRHLTAPVPYVPIEERRAAHDELATKLRAEQDAKRAKDKANRVARKAKQAPKESGQAPTTGAVLAVCDMMVDIAQSDATPTG